jgi:WD40 repeat protein
MRHLRFISTLLFLLSIGITSSLAQDTPTPIPITRDNASQLVEQRRLGDGALRYIEIAPNGRYFAVTGYMGAWLYAIDLPTKPILHVDGHSNLVSAFDITADLSRMVTGGYDGKLIMWDVATSQPILTSDAVLGDSDLIVRGAYFHDNDDTLISMTNSSDITLWDNTTLIPHTSRVVDGLIRASAYSPQGDRIAVGISGGVSQLWRVTDDDELVFEHQFEGQSVLMYDVAFDTRGERLATASWDETVIVWDVETKEQIITLYLDFLPISVLFDAYTHNRLIIGGSDGTIYFYDIETGDMQSSFPANAPFVQDIAQDVTQGALISLGFDDIMIWDYEGVIQMPQLRQNLSFNYRYPVNGVAYNTEGTHLTMLGFDDFRRYDTTTWEYVAESVPNYDDYASIVYSPDGKYTVLTSWDGVVIVLDTATGEFLYDYPISAQMVSISPDSHYMALQTDENIIEIIHIETGVIQKTFSGGRDGSVSLAFSPDGTLLAVGGWDGFVLLVDVETTDTRHRLPTDEYGVQAIAFSPDGQLIAGNSTDGTIIVWDVNTGDSVITMTSDTGDSISSIAFSPNGEIIASGDVEGVLSLWDAETGLLLYQIEEHRSDIMSMTFNADGSQLVTGSYDGTMRVWGINNP